MNILFSISSFTAQTVSFKFLQQYVHRNTQKIAHNIVLGYGRVVVIDGKGSSVFYKWILALTRSFNDILLAKFQGFQVFVAINFFLCVNRSLICCFLFYDLLVVNYVSKRINTPSPAVRGGKMICRNISHDRCDADLPGTHRSQSQ